MTRRETLERELGALNDEHIRLDREMNMLYNFDVLSASEEEAVNGISERLMQIDKRMDEIEAELIWGAF